MGRWHEFWERHDPDNVFSYNTFKMVTIRDRYLGLLHHSFQFGILIYIIVYVIFVSKQFLVKDLAQGLVRLSVIDMGVGNVDPAMTQICATNRCIYPVVDQIAQGTGPDMFITTYLNETGYTYNCNLTNPACLPDITYGPVESYIGNIDDIYLSLDHSAQVNFDGKAPLGYLQSSKNPNADIPSWQDCTECSQYKFRSLAADRISLSDLMTAAHLNLEDIATDYLKGTSDYYNATFRGFGAVILLSVTYDNVDNYWNKDPPIKYYYRPQLISEIDDFLIQSIYTTYPTSRTLLINRGIRILGVIAGEIGTFNFQALLIQLTTSLALMKVATTVVDLIAINILPKKLLYKTAKYELTKDFSDIRMEEKQSKLHVSTPSEIESSTNAIAR